MTALHLLFLRKIFFFSCGNSYIVRTPFPCMFTNKKTRGKKLNAKTKMYIHVSLYEKKKQTTNVIQSYQSDMIRVELKIIQSHHLIKLVSKLTVLE